MPYGQRWRMHRKLLNNFIAPSMVKDYDVNQVRVVSDLLVNLHRKPKTFREHIHLCVVFSPCLAVLTCLTLNAAHIQAHRLAGSLNSVRDPGGHSG